MKPIVCALVGPTGVGKTRAAIRLCEALNAEIVSMDSMQVYRGMDIGTAKPTAQERQAARHHLIDIVDPEETFTVASYRERAFEAFEDILSRDRLPLLVGGTGLYLQAVSFDMRLGESGADEALREELRRVAEEIGGRERLHARLALADPQSAARLHPNDVRRVIRAIEIAEHASQSKSEQRDERREGPYRVLPYGLSLPRERMYARIDARVDEMIQDGLVAEVKMLLDQGVEPKDEGGAMQAIGYKEIVSALRGEYTMDRAVALVKQGSRRYAKRQWTWFRHDPRVKWFDWTDYPAEDALLSELEQTMRRDIAAAREQGE